MVRIHPIDVWLRFLRELCIPVSVTASNSELSMTNPLAPQLQQSWKRRLQTPTKSKRLLAAIAVLWTLASTSIAVPVSNSLAPAQNVMGNSTCHPMQNFRYTIAFDSVFGGHWNLTDHTHVNADGTYTDSFRGTVSDTSIQTRSPVTTLIGPVTAGSSADTLRSSALRSPSLSVTEASPALQRTHSAEWNDLAHPCAS